MCKLNKLDWSIFTNLCRLANMMQKISIDLGLSCFALLLKLSPILPTNTMSHPVQSHPSSWSSKTPLPVHRGSWGWRRGRPGPLSSAPPAPAASWRSSSVRWRIPLRPVACNIKTIRLKSSSCRCANVLYVLWQVYISKYCDAAVTGYFRMWGSEGRGRLGRL